MTYATMSHMHSRSEKRKELLIFLYLVVVSSLLLMKYSTSSPAYFMNQWVDTDASLTVGRSILQGIVPYRDLFDQRGPLLYLISALCSIFEFPNTFFGFYIYEVLCGGIFLYFCRKLLHVFSGESADVFLATAPFFYWLLLREADFGLGGSPEELCLPAISIALYSNTSYTPERTVDVSERNMDRALCRLRVLDQIQYDGIVCRSCNCVSDQLWNAVRMEADRQCSSRSDYRNRDNVIPCFPIFRTEPCAFRYVHGVFC